jgi:hypothetical protein
VKTTPALIADVLALSGAGKSQVAIGRQLGCSARLVNRIACGWRPMPVRTFKAPDLRRAYAEDRFRTRAQAEARVIEMWPRMSIRDIARELDTSVPFVQTAAAKAGLASRPIAYVPGAEPNPRSRWARK